MQCGAGKISNIPEAISVGNNAAGGEGIKSKGCGKLLADYTRRFNM
jgi:hypothetical protein